MAGLSQGVRFNKGQTEYQLYPEEYFSGANVNVYFGDVFMDDIMALQFVMKEKVAPVYGYASRTFDRVLRGNRLVQGYFRMAFREAGYLYTVLDHIAQLQGASKHAVPAMGYLAQGQAVPQWHGSVKNRIEDILSNWAKEKPNDPNATAEPRMVEYEKEIWGRRFVEGSDSVRKNESYFLRGRKTDLLGYHPTYGQLDQKGFDIYINYGALPDYIQQQLAKLGNKLPNEISFNNTVRAIRNIQIMDLEVNMDAQTGEPISETYYFIAQDLD